MGNIKIVIVDDEQEACDNLQAMLKDFTDIELSGIAHSTTEAEVLIREMNPSVLFLDIDMPCENAFQFLGRLAVIPFEVVFVTAYDEYAVKAFRLNAVDYILKPIDVNDLSAAIGKVREKLLYKQTMNANLLKSVSDVMEHRKKQEQIILRNNHHYEVVPFKDIYYVEAIGRYSSITYFKDGSDKNLLMSHTIAEYEELFPSQLFFRVHRSFLVNGSLVRRIRKNTGTQLLSLTNGTDIPISRRRYGEVMDFLKSSNFYAQ